MPSKGIRRLALALLLLAAATAAAAAEPGPPVFDGERAMAWLVRQCELGPRPPGTTANRTLRRLIAATAEAAGLTVRRDCFETVSPLTGDTLTACNLVVSTPDDGAERLWLGAHFDTRPLSDRDPDPDRRGEALIGANDGASGTAVLLHLIELLGARPPALGADLIFFDAEDSGHAGDSGSFCLGSARLAAGLGGFGSPLDPARTRGLILLDMVGDRDLQIPMEGYSLRYAPAWTRAVFERAARLGLSAFAPVPGPPVYDDHVPFLQRGVPAVDLIDFDYPAWHTTGDVPAACSAASLEQVGRLLTDLLYHP